MAQDCILPYMHVLVQTNGKIKLCCNSYETEQPNITDQPFNELINNTLHSRVRQEFSQGIIPKECNKCFEQEKNGLVSYRQEQNFIHKDRIKENKLVYLDVRFNNTCNLKCVMCSSEYSSLWVEDEIKLNKINFYDKDKFKWSNENDVLQSIKDNSDTLERIHFAGGEPLLSKQHSELLDYLIETSKSTNLMISYNTNITLIDKETIEKWNKFKNVKVFLSIDGISDVLEYIRYPIKYNEIDRIFGLIETYSNNNIRYVFHYTLSALNLLSFPDFVEYKINLPYNKISKNELFTVDCVTNPECLSLTVLPKNLVNSVSDRLDELKIKYPDYKEQIDKLHKKILVESKKPPISELDNLFDYCSQLDKIRNTDSSFITDKIKTYL